MVDICVIGGGPAGVTAALRARELGASVALVEAGQLGGTCTNDGCVPTRVLAHAARLMSNARQYAAYGITLPDPELDFQRLLARTQEIVYEVHEKKQLAAHLEASGVQVFAPAGAARFVDPHTIELGESGQRVQARRFILCAGGRARRLDFPGEELSLTHSDIWRLDRLPRSIAVVGGAATGCQLASIFDAFGAQVTLLEVAPRILRAEDDSISAAITAAFTRRGMTVVTGISGIQSIERAADGLALNYTNNGEGRVVRAGAVIMSTGWLGNVASLNLVAAGVQTDGRYVQTDETMRTSAPHIFAAGDITGRIMLVQTAGAEARLAAENAVLGAGQRQDASARIVPHGGFTEPEYASVGPSEEEARKQLDCAISTVPYADMDRAVIDGRTEGFCKLIVSRETHRLIAAHVVGDQALEIVHIVAAGMAADMWAEQLAELQIAYPTYNAILGLAARRIVDQLGVMPLAPEWRSLGRPPAEWERREREEAAVLDQVKGVN